MTPDEHHKPELYLAQFSGELYKTGPQHMAKLLLQSSLARVDKEILQQINKLSREVFAARSMFPLEFSNSVLIAMMIWLLLAGQMRQLAIGPISGQLEAML